MRATFIYKKTFLGKYFDRNDSRHAAAKNPEISEMPISGFIHLVSDLFTKNHYDLFVDSVDLSLQFFSNDGSASCFKSCLEFCYEFFRSAVVLTISKLLHVVGADIVTGVDVGTNVGNISDELTICIVRSDLFQFCFQRIYNFPVDVCGLDFQIVVTSPPECGSDSVVISIILTKGIKIKIL